MKGQNHKRTSWRAGVRDGFTSSGEVCCNECFKKKLEIEKLRIEKKRLQQRVKILEENIGKVTKKELSGAHVPSSKIPFKRKANIENVQKKGGASIGHKGHGRKKIQEATCSVSIQAPDLCPSCNVSLKRDGVRQRAVLDTTEVKVEKKIYERSRGRCLKCGKVYTSDLPVFSRALYGNALLAKIAVMHYVHGITLGRVCEILGPEVKVAGIIAAFHRLSKLCEPALFDLIERYKGSPVKHADETGWRTDGQSGWAWLFCSPDLSIFQHHNTRSARVPLAVLGEKQLPGVLVADRFSGYNRAPCKIQHCYAHLLREVKKIEEDFPDDKETTLFVSNFAPLISLAMRLGGRNVSDKEYYKQAREIKSNIEIEVSKKYKHLAIKRIQHIFTKNHGRLYHWGEDRRVPAHNNRAEREIRQVVISRKISFGSQSEAGAKTRSVLMTVLLTAKKRLAQTTVEDWFKNSLDKIALNPSLSFSSLIPHVPP